MANKIYIICEQDIFMKNGEEDFRTGVTLLQGFETLNKAKETLEEWVKKRNAKLCPCAPKPGFKGYVVEHNDISTYRWIDVVGIAN